MYRPLDPIVDWPFFDHGFGIGSEDREVVLALCEAASSELWRTHVSAKQAERHPMLLPSSHWLTPNEYGPNWVAEFNNDSECSDSPRGKVESFLLKSFQLEEMERVFFISMREHCYSVPIHFFARHWPCFLAGDDEGAFLFHPASGRFAQFGPNGSVGFGIRAVSNVV